MNQEIKAKWIAALRSGEYTQTIGKLYRHRPDFADQPGYCCLGVLCDLHAKETENAWQYSSEGYGHYFSECDELPATVIQWAGLPDGNPMVTTQYKYEGTDEYVDLTVEIAKLNDDFNFTFEQLADVIDTTF